MNSTKHLEKSLQPSFSNYSKTLEKETLLNSFYKASITLMKKNSDKDITKNKMFTDEHKCKVPQHNTHKQNSPMHCRIIHHDHFDLSQVCKDGSTTANQPM